MDQERNLRIAQDGTFEVSEFNTPSLGEEWGRVVVSEVLAGMDSVGEAVAESGSEVWGAETQTRMRESAVGATNTMLTLRSIYFFVLCLDSP